MQNTPERAPVDFIRVLKRPPCSSV